VTAKTKKALYPGAFDPLTLGHLDLIQRAVSMFGEVVVAVLRNPGKEPLFTLEERMELVRKATAPFKKKVRVVSFDGLLVDLMQKEGYPVAIRGLRVVSDFEYEFQMALMNRKQSSRFEVVFLMTDEKYTYLSSTLVREIARLGGDLKGLVPPAIKSAVYKKLK
jgi:pantetheine-phosphate adenylyltransferase